MRESISEVDVFRLTKILKPARMPELNSKITCKRRFPILGLTSEDLLFTRFTFEVFVLNKVEFFLFMIILRSSGTRKSISEVF